MGAKTYEIFHGDSMGFCVKYSMKIPWKTSCSMVIPWSKRPGPPLCRIDLNIRSRDTLRAKRASTGKMALVH